MQDLPPSHGRSQFLSSPFALWEAPNSHLNLPPSPNLHLNTGWALRILCWNPASLNHRSPLGAILNCISKINYSITAPVPHPMPTWPWESWKKSPILLPTRQFFHKERQHLLIASLDNSPVLQALFQTLSFVVWNPKMALYSATKYPFESPHAEENSGYF